MAVTVQQPATNDHTICLGVNIMSIPYSEGGSQVDRKFESQIPLTFAVGRSSLSPNSSRVPVRLFTPPCVMDCNGYYIRYFCCM